MQTEKAYLYKRIVESKLYMDEHYLEDITIDSIANEACFSKFHFIRIFRDAYGITPHKYLTGLRISKAKELLQAGLSISDACYSLGFESLSSFTKLFKRHLNINPSNYAVSSKTMLRDCAATPLKFVPQCYIDYMHWDK